MTKQREVPIARPQKIQSTNTIGGRIREARYLLNYSIRELADLSGVSPTSIGKFENNRGKPSIKSLRKLSSALNVPISYLGCFESLPEDTLAQKIYKARLYHGFTKKELAIHLGVDEKTIRNWENGTTELLDVYNSNFKELLSIL